MSKIVFTCVVLLLSYAAAASTDSDWAGCLCWDSVQGHMCQNNTDSCKQLAYREAPTIVGLSLAFIVGFFLLFFPLFFALGRCCNCCGGRNPSYGCCCPYKRLGMARVYSRSTVNAARFWALVTLGGMIAGAVMFHVAVDDAMDTLEDVRNLAQNLTTSAQTLNSEASQAAAQLAPYGVSPLNLQIVGEVISDLNSVVDAIKDVPSQVRTSAYLGYIPVGVAALVCILALFGVRGFIITCLAMFMSFFAALFLVLLFGVGTGAASANLACDQPTRYDSTASFVNASLSINTLSSTVGSAVNTAESDALSYICETLHLADLCSPDAFNCVPNPCGNQYLSVDSALTLVNWTMNNKEGGSFHNMSIVDCTAHPVECSMFYTAASDLTATYNQMLPAITLVSPSLNPLVNRAIDGSVGSQTMGLLCGSAKSSLMKLTDALLVLSGVSLFAIFVFVRGAKRFSAGSPVMAHVVPPLPQQQYDNPVDAHQYRAWGAPNSVEAQPILGQIHPETFAAEQQQQYGTQHTVNGAKTASDAV